MPATHTETTSRRARRAVRRRQRPVIEFREVTATYPDGAVALERVSMRIGRGELAFLLGPTGSGKTTCLRLLLKELEPSEGEVLVAGASLARLPRRRIPHLRRDIGVVLQDSKLLPNRTVYANVAYPLEVIGEGRTQVRCKVPEVLGLFGLWRRRHDHPADLSSGEQQRLAIARAFVNRPPLLLADEPAGGLDPEASIGIMQLLHRINRTGTTVVVATHDREMVEKLPRRTIELRGGRVVRDVSPGRPGEQVSIAEIAARLRRELDAGARGVR